MSSASRPRKRPLPLAATSSVSVAVDMWLAAVVVLCTFSSPVRTQRPPDGEYQALNSTVQYWNFYCRPRSSDQSDVDHVSCHFDKQPAHLGDASLLKNPSTAPGGSDTRTLHLEINNCSMLVISSEFQTTWRKYYKRLYLTISDVEDVSQEEAIGYISPISNLISFSLIRSNMEMMYPHLMSSTSALLIELKDSSIGYVTERTFENVNELWYLRVFSCQINCIERNAMPTFLSIAPQPSNSHDDTLAPFVFNATHIQELMPEAVKFHVSTNTEYLNFVHCKFSVIHSRGLQVTGKGHVLFANTQLALVEDDAFLVSLAANETNRGDALMPSMIKYPTLTLMSLTLSSVNVSNFLDNLHVGQGKLYLMRINLAFPGVLQSISDYSTRWSNQSVFIERVTASCDCLELDDYLLGSGTADGEPPSADTDLLLHDPAVDYEDARSLPKSSADQSPAQQMRNELLCYVPGEESVRPHKYRALYCVPPDVFVDVDPVVGVETESLDPELALAYKHWLVYASAGAVFVFLATLLGLYVYRKRRNYNLDRRRCQAQQNAKGQVGVLSEDPIFEAEVEDEC